MTTRAGRGAVLITGASTGIGRATALRLDRLGFQVLAGVRKEADGDDLRGAATGLLAPILIDVTDDASIAAAREQVEQIVGGVGLAGLINNAGVGISGAIEYAPADKVRWMFDVNVFGLLATTSAFLPLVRRARGRIVNVGSIASLGVVPFHGTYSASKLAVRGISDALRLEMRPFGVQVAHVVCGSVKTPIWEKGRALSDEHRGTLPAELTGAYGAAAERMAQNFVKIADNGISAEQAGVEIARTMTDHPVRHTYYVGPDARRFRFLSVLLGGRLGDKLLLRSLGLDVMRR